MHPKENCHTWDGTPGSCKDPDDCDHRHPKICPFNTIGRCVFRNKCVLLHKDPSGQMTAVDKLLKALKLEVSELKEEVKVLKQEKGDTMKTVKKDVLQVEAKEELKDLKTKQSSLAEETNKRLNILASTQDIFNKNQTEELKDLRRMLTEKTLDTNTEPNSTMTKQKMDYLTTEMSNFTTQLNNLAERQMTVITHYSATKKKELGKDVEIIELKRAVKNLDAHVLCAVDVDIVQLKEAYKKFDVQQTRFMDTMADIQKKIKQQLVVVVF